MSDVLSRLVPYAKYCAGRPNLYPSKGAVEWGLRQIREEAVAAGALLLYRGQWHVDPVAFERVVLDKAHRDAARLVDRARAEE